MCKITKSAMQPLYGVLFTFIHLPFLLGVKERSTRSLDDPFFRLHAFIARYTCRGDYRVRSANKVQKIVNKWTFVRAIRETALITKQPYSVLNIPLRVKVGPLTLKRYLNELRIIPSYERQPKVKA